MVVSGALVWCRRDGQLLPLRLDSIRLSGAVTEAHWDAVTNFLDLVASQRLVIQDEGISVHSTPESPLSDGVSKFSDSFANLIQEQTYAKKYSLSDCDGNRKSDGLGRLSEDQECSAHNAMLWSRKPPKTGVQIKKTGDLQRKNLNGDIEVINSDALENVVGETQGIFDPGFNVKQGVIPKFGIFDYDEGYRFETCEETHQVATVLKSDQTQRIQNVGCVSETINLHCVLQRLKHVNRTEEVVAVLNCQECEQTQHMFSGNGGSTSGVLNLQCKQVPTKPATDLNCQQFEIQESESKTQVQEVDDSSVVESVVGGSGCPNQENSRRHTTVSDDSSSTHFLANMLSRQAELQKSLPQWQILKTEPIEYISESTSCQSVTCRVSGKSCVNRFRVATLVGRIGGGTESSGQDCTSVSPSTPMSGNLSLVEESTGNTDPKCHQQKAFEICEKCKCEMFPQSVAQNRDGDENIKHVSCQHQISDHNALSICRCHGEQDALKRRNQIYTQNPKVVTTLCQNCHSQCKLSDVYLHNLYACHRSNNFLSQTVTSDGNCNVQQGYEGVHQQIWFPLINQYSTEQQLIQECDLDHRILRTSEPDCNQITSGCQAERAVYHQFVLQNRMSRSGIPVSGLLQSKRELNISVCNQCGLEKRISEMETPGGNTVHAKCHKVSLDCRECDTENRRKFSEASQGTDCQQREMKNIFQTMTPEKSRVPFKCRKDIVGCQEYVLEKQENTPEVDGNNCQQSEFGKRMFQSGLPGRKLVSFRCQECALGKQLMAPELDRISGCQQGLLHPSVEDQVRLHCGIETGGEDAISQCNQEGQISSGVSRYQYSDDGVHHKKKRTVALWQRLLRKHVSVSGRRKLVSVAIVHPTTSASGP